MNKKNIISNFIEEWFTVILMLLGFALLYFTAHAYLGKFEEHLMSSTSDTELMYKESIERFGQFGDFMGGILNPTFAFLSYMAILWTLKVQIKALNTSKEELAKSSEALTEQSKSLKLQNFENTFFNMLNLHNEIVNSSSLSMFKEFEEEYIKEILQRGLVGEKIIKEKRYFYKIGSLKVNIEEDKEYNGRKSLYRLFEILNVFIKYYARNDKDIVGLYNAFHLEYSQIINHYFRNLYHILKIVDDQNDFNLDKKKYYTSILRAQVSNYELALIFMNAIYKEGDSKLFPLLVEFEFMEPLNLVIAQPYNGNVTFHKYLIDETYLKYVIKDYLKKIRKMNCEDKIFGSNNHMKEYINYINTSSQEQQ